MNLGLRCGGFSPVTEKEGYRDGRLQGGGTAEEAAR
jgi:hypothetical protein